MKYVPSFPPPGITGVDRVTVTALATVKAAKAVQSRTLPPLVATPHEHHEPVRELAERGDYRHGEGERRTYCRRVQHLPVLVELRSGMERRHHNQRAGDPVEHIDIEV
ncbi:MAG: hypothetical protein A2063_06315 [Gallionellales bacterium GWA2_60_142]|nr:MAG: hypothetical protein A2063_06315 [Gallionellales bacterium GWA2_60_142]HCI14559.1 hypothetical protein [Gallionellaceae bacterium]